MKSPVINVMTIDLEEWFQVTNFEGIIARSDWDHCQARVPEILPRLLDLFAEHNVRATFFVLGWIAERHPEWIRRIHRAGHEIASHGYDHRRLTHLNPAELRQQLRQSKTMLEDLTGDRVDGFRAPSYALCKKSCTVIEELLKAGYLFDSSIFPYGGRFTPNICGSKYPCLLYCHGHTITEYPLSIATLCGMDTPIAGGGYFRLLPYFVIKKGIEKINRENVPAIMYFHPWEFDPGQPRVRQASCLSKFRHYVNLERNEAKLRQLVKDFTFTSFRELFWNATAKKYATSPRI